MWADQLASYACLWEKGYVHGTVKHKNISWIHSTHEPHRGFFWGVTKKMFRARWQAFQGKRIQEKLQGCVFLWLATRLPEMSAECPVMKRLGVPNPYFVLGGREGGRK